MSIYSLCERKTASGEEPRGISCDEEGVFIAGDVPLVTRSSGAHSQVVYRARPAPEIARLLKSAYGAGTDFSAHIEGLNRIAQYMTDGKWPLAKIAAVHLRLPDLSDDAALVKLLKAEAELIAGCCSRCAAAKTTTGARKTRKRDVSNEPRVPSGETGGGEWTSGTSPTSTANNPLLVPAQAITAPMPVPAPFELPMLPDEVAPAPFAVPGAGLRPPPLVNPYPNKRKCVEEWEEAEEFCADMAAQGKLVPGPRGKRTRGYSGFGKDYNSCVLGRVSEECGGSPKA